MAWFDNAIAHDIIDTHFLGDLRAHLRHPARPPQVPTWLWPLLRPAAGPVLTHLTNVVTRHAATPHQGLVCPGPHRRPSGRIWGGRRRAAQSLVAAQSVSHRFRRPPITAHPRESTMTPTTDHTTAKLDIMDDDTLDRAFATAKSHAAELREWAQKWRDAWNTQDLDGVVVSSSVIPTRAAPHRRRVGKSTPDVSEPGAACGFPTPSEPCTKAQDRQAHRR